MDIEKETGSMKMKWKIPLFLIAFGLAGMAALYAYILSYDVNRLKPNIIAAVKNATGRNLNIKGKIKIAIGLSPLMFRFRPVKFFTATIISGLSRFTSYDRI